MDIVIQAAEISADRCKPLGANGEVRFVMIWLEELIYCFGDNAVPFVHPFVLNFMCIERWYCSLGVQVAKLSW